MSDHLNDAKKDRKILGGCLSAFIWIAFFFFVNKLPILLTRFMPISFYYPVVFTAALLFASLPWIFFIIEITADKA